MAITTILLLMAMAMAMAMAFAMLFWLLIKRAEDLEKPRLQRDDLERTRSVGTEGGDSVLSIELIKLKERLFTASQHRTIDSILFSLRNSDLQKAVDEIGRLVEDLLRKKASSTPHWNSDSKFLNLLEIAVTEGWLDSESTSTMTLLKDFRDKISSRLEVKLEPSRAIFFISFSIGVICRLTR